jgi:hypothetical protein
MVEEPVWICATFRVGHARADGGVRGDFEHLT